MSIVDDVGSIARRLKEMEDGRNREIAFRQWFAEVVGHAERIGAPELIGDPDSHRDSFEDGVDPKQEVHHQITHMYG